MASGYKYFMTLVGIIAIIGYMFQVRYVSIIYFQYKVENHYFIQIPLLISMPRLHVCIDLIDALNREKLLTDLNVNMKRFHDPGFNYDEYLYQLKQLTIKQMFRYTPLTDEILDPNGDACKIRYPFLYAVNSLPDSICSQLVTNVSKYLHRQQVCYKFDIMTPDQLKAVYPNGKMPQLAIQEYTGSPDKTYLVYEINLNQELFPSLTIVNVYVERPGSSQFQSSASSVIFPIDSFVLPPSQDKENPTDGEGEGIPTDSKREKKSGDRTEKKVPRKLGRLKMDFRLVSLDRLPPPYFTNCTNIPGFKTIAEYFTHEIDRESIRRFGIITPFAFINDSQSELKVLSILDIRNITFMRKFAEITKDINPNINECHVEATITSGSQVLQDEKLTVSIIWPKSDDVYAEYVPYQLMSEYIIFMFSCCGFWFGTSFLTIWSDLLSVRDFYSRTRNRKVAPSYSIKLDAPDHSAFNATNRLVRRIDMVADKVFAVEGKFFAIEQKVMAQNILWHRVNQLQSETRTHGTFINALIRKTNRSRKY